MPVDFPVGSANDSLGVRRPFRRRWGIFSNAISSHIDVATDAVPSGMGWHTVQFTDWTMTLQGHGWADGLSEALLEWMTDNGLPPS